MVEPTEEKLVDQSLEQKKMLLAGSDHAPIIIELMKDCMANKPIVEDTEWMTIVNAITLEANGTMLRGMVDHLEAIREKGINYLKPQQ